MPLEHGSVYLPPTSVPSPLPPPAHLLVHHPVSHPHHAHVAHAPAPSPVACHHVEHPDGVEGVDPKIVARVAAGAEDDYAGPRAVKKVGKVERRRAPVPPPVIIAVIIAGAVRGVVGTAPPRSVVPVVRECARMCVNTCLRSGQRWREEQEEVCGGRAATRDPGSRVRALATYSISCM